MSEGADGHRVLGDSGQHRRRADWLCDRDTWPTDTLPSLWCLVAFVYDPQNVADFDTKVLGYYRPTMEAPVRTSSTITLSLSDRVLNDLSSPTSQRCATG